MKHKSVWMRLDAFACSCVFTRVESGEGGICERF